MESYNVGPGFGKLSDVTVIHGDCIEAMREMPAESVDAIVTDPPYGLEFMGKEWDKFPLRDRGPRLTGSGNPTEARGFGGNVAYGKSSASLFAFQQWCQLWAAEALRVLKPGGHLLAFGGTRTFHRLACAIEDAGFEIRDSIAWLYGSGFPKSLDVSKAIDKARNDNSDRLAAGQWLRAQREAVGLKQKEVAAHWPSATGGLTGCVANWELGLSCPTWAQWLDLKRIIGFPDDMDAEVWRLNGRKGTPGEAWATADVLRTEDRMNEASGVVNVGQGERTPVTRQIKAANSPEAQQWQGWGTALKPAFEPIIVGRKPLQGTVAANVLAYGTGALNVDGCRIGTEESTSRPRGSFPHSDDAWGDGRPNEVSISNPLGRWPANVILDESSAAELDQQSGRRPSGGSQHQRSTASTGIYGEFNPGRNVSREPDSGGASRFFYCAKAPKRERPTVNGVAHPTVKPLALMRWLVRLVTPPGGTVLDPFAGSGTTIEAALLEDFRVIGIENDTEHHYMEMIQQRIMRVWQSL